VSRTARRRPLPAAVAGWLLPLLLVLAACSQSAAGSFDPEAPCAVDGQQPGAYPELEAALPSTFQGEAPARLDSGRNCTEEALGTLTGHGIDELRFAGALWETGRRSGITVAVFRAPGLTADRLAEFYEAGAREARKTENVTTRRMKVEGVTGHRLDTLNDESYQTIVVLEEDAADTVHAVLVASDVREIGTKEAHDEVVREAANLVVGQ
jgi:hypothetical protein